MSRRLGVARPSVSLIRSVPVQSYVFDLLSVDGHDLRALPYLARRERLAELALPSGPLLVSPYYLGVPVSRMLEVAAEHQLEGVIGKRVDAPYRSGRSQAWRKLPLRRTTEVIVVGWLPSRTHRLFGALPIAAHDSRGRLVLLGSVGTGFSDTTRRTLHHQLLTLATPTSPITDTVPSALEGAARWVVPRLVGEVAYREKQVVLHPMQHSTFRPTRGQCRLEDCSAFASQAGLIWQTAANQLRIIDASDTTGG